MMMSSHSENTLYEVFTEKKVEKQNKVMYVILGCLLIGATILLCILII